MHGVPRPQVTEHQIDGGEDADGTATRAEVLDLQRQELHRRGDRHERRQLRLQPVLAVLKDAVPEAVSAGVRRVAGARPWHRAEEPSARIVAEVENLAARIADGVVAPRRQSIELGIAAPSVGAAALADYGAEPRVGNDIHPWRRSVTARREVDDVLAPVRREAADAIGEDQIVSRKHRCDTPFRRGRLARGGQHRGPRQHHGLPPAFQLLIERTINIPDDDPRHRLQQHAVLLGEAIDVSHEHAARLVQQLGLGAGGDEPQDLVVEHAPVTRGVFVPDHQVGQQAPHPPVGMRPEQVAHQVQVVGVAYAEQHDREVARDRVSPEARLTLAVAPQDAA